MTDGDFSKVALVAVGAGKLLDEGVIDLVDTNGGDISEEAITALALSLLEKIAWWVVGERATAEVEDDRVS